MERYFMTYHTIPYSPIDNDGDDDRQVSVLWNLLYNFVLMGKLGSSPICTICTGKMKIDSLERRAQRSRHGHVTACQTWLRKTIEKLCDSQRPPHIWLLLLLMNERFHFYSHSIVAGAKKTYRTVSICCHWWAVAQCRMYVARHYFFSFFLYWHFTLSSLSTSTIADAQIWKKPTCHCLNGEWYRKNETERRKKKSRRTTYQSQRFNIYLDIRTYASSVHDKIQSRTVSLIYPDKRADMHFNPSSTCYGPRSNRNYCIQQHQHSAAARIAYSKTISEKQKRVLSWINTLQFLVHIK